MLHWNGSMYRYKTNINEINAKMNYNRLIILTCILILIISQNSFSQEDDILFKVKSFLTLKDSTLGKENPGIRIFSSSERFDFPLKQKTPNISNGVYIINFMASHSQPFIMIKNGKGLTFIEDYSDNSIFSFYYTYTQNLNRRKKHLILEEIVDCLYQRSLFFNGN